MKKMVIKSAALARRFLTAAQQHPFRFGLAMATGTAIASDVTVQKVIEKREQVDLARSAAFGLFGFVYLGQFQYALYVRFFNRIFPNAFSFAAKPLREKFKDPRGMFNWFAQVFFDLAIHRPLIYFPVVYATKELVLQDNPDIMKSLETYRENAWDDCTAMLKVWGPATILNFGFSPLYMRVPFTGLVRLCWTLVLSTMRGGDITQSDKLAGDVVSGAAFSILEEGFEEMSYAKSAQSLETDMSHVVITACGPDRVGIVLSLAKAVNDLDGNVTYSRMVRLGHDFIFLIHVAIPHHKKRLLIQGLQTNDELKSLNIVTSGLSRKLTGAGTFQPPTVGLRITCIGKDRPGMLVRIAEFINQKGMNIEDVTTEMVLSKSGQRDFVVTADCVTPIAMGKDHLENLAKEFSPLKEELQLDIMDVRLHKL